MATTPLQRYREDAGLRAIELAALADISPRSVNRLESRHPNVRAQVKEVTRRKVWNALNGVRKKLGRPELAYEELFPIANEGS